LVADLKERPCGLSVLGSPQVAILRPVYAEGFSLMKRRKERTRLRVVRGKIRVLN
jgi:hypothetical protein